MDTLSNPNSDARNNIRIKINLQGQYKLEKSNSVYACEIVNLSALGAGIQLKSSVIKGDNIRIQFSLKGHSFQLNGIVNYASGKTVGIIFKDYPNGHEYIRKYTQAQFLKNLH